MGVITNEVIISSSKVGLNKELKFVGSLAFDEENASNLFNYLCLVS
jgi:hypothetical protein